MYKDLSKENCVPDDENRGHLMAGEIEELLPQIPKWNFENHEKLVRNFVFRDYKEALEFAGRVGKLAEKEEHYPDISIGKGYAKVSLFTPSVEGVTENDFILAAKIDRL